jgi:hypothetical protein
VAANNSLRGIDVLIDLMGWSEQARPGIVAYHPGSLQLTWTLVPEPSGLAAVDGVIADGSMLTQKQVPEFAEAVHWLEPAHPVIGESLASFQKRVEQLIGNVHAKLPHRTVWTPLPAQTLQYLSAPRGLGRRYVIVAPPFEHASAGIRVLYDLQKWLTLAGLDAIVCFASGAGLWIGVFETKINLARVSFAIRFAALSADAIRHASQRREVALVSGVHKRLRAELRFGSRLGEVFGADADELHR